MIWDNKVREDSRGARLVQIALKFHFVKHIGLLNDLLAL